MISSGRYLAIYYDRVPTWNHSDFIERRRALLRPRCRRYRRCRSTRMTREYKLWAGSVLTAKKKAMFTALRYSRWRRISVAYLFQSAAGRYLLGLCARSTTPSANYRPNRSWSTRTTSVVNSTFPRRRASCASISGEFCLFLKLISKDYFYFQTLCLNVFI